MRWRPDRPVPYPTLRHRRIAITTLGLRGTITDGTNSARHTPAETVDDDGMTPRQRPVPWVDRLGRLKWSWPSQVFRRRRMTVQSPWEPRQTTTVSRIGPVVLPLYLLGSGHLTYGA